jgi:hypothetical protein
MLGRGLSRWWTLPLEMLSMCTCYSPRVHAIVGCIGDSSGTCHLLITQRSHLWLFLHVSGSCWTTCRVPGVPHVSFLLTHVSYCGWIMCHFFIRPCVIFLLVHVAVSYSTTSHGADCPRFVFFIRPRVLTTSFHVSDFNSPHVVSRLFHVSCTSSSTYRIFI